MKNVKLTRGKLLFYVFLILTTAFSCYAVSTADFSTGPTFVNVLGMLFAIIDAACWLFLLISYIVENWDTPLKK